jgi:hypothetical protein
MDKDKCIYPGCPAGGTEYSLQMIMRTHYGNICGYVRSAPLRRVCDLDRYRVIQLHPDVIPIEGRYKYNYHDICYTKYFEDQYSGIYLFTDTKLIYIDGKSVSVFSKTNTNGIYVLICCYRGDDMAEFLYSFTYEHLWDSLRQEKTYASTIPKDIHDIVHDYIVPE